MNFIEIQYRLLTESDGKNNQCQTQNMTDLLHTNSLEIVIEQVCLGGLERKGRLRVAEWLRHTFPNSRASVRKGSFTKCFCVYTRVTKGRMQIIIVLLECNVEGNFLALHTSLAAAF